MNWIEIIFGSLFCIALVANAATMARHWHVMRALEILINGWAKSQQELFDLMDKENKTPNGSTRWRR